MGFFSSILGGVLGAKSGKDNTNTIKELAQGDKDFYNQQWQNALQANRVNQTNPLGSLTWSKDANGNWTQTQTNAPAEQARLEDYRQIIANRLGAAKGIDLGAYSKPIDYNSIGLGAIGQAAGVAAGNTGKRSWYDDPIAGAAHPAPTPYTGQTAPNVAGQSMGGQLLRPMGNLPVAPEGATAPQAPAASAPPPQQEAVTALQAQIAQLMEQLNAMKSGQGQPQGPIDLSQGQ